MVLLLEKDLKLNLIGIEYTNVQGPVNLLWIVYSNS